MRVKKNNFCIGKAKVINDICRNDNIYKDILKVLKDSFGRIHSYLRISLTDRCNFNCIYCNPAHLNFKKIDRTEILSFDEILRLINIFVKDLGFNKIRFTGGEPFARNGVMDFFERLSPVIKEYNLYTGITTNGTLLKGKLEKLINSGINNLNISLDSLVPEKFTKITNSPAFSDVIVSIDKAIQCGFNIKVNSVIIRGINDDELTDFVRFAIDRNLNIRFIEFMPFADNRWNENSFIGYKEMKERISSKYRLEEIENDNISVSKDYLVPGTGGKVSFISSVSDHFCGSCSRLRITASGSMKLCLFSVLSEGLDLKSLLRYEKVTDSEIAEAIREKIFYKKYKHPEPAELIQLSQHKMIDIGG